MQRDIQVTRSQSHHLFGHMHIQVAFIISLYPVPFVIGICLLYMYPYLLLYHPLLLGHTCEISYCKAILCVPCKKGHYDLVCTTGQLHSLSTQYAVFVWHFPTCTIPVKVHNELIFACLSFFEQQVVVIAIFSTFTCYIVLIYSYIAITLKPKLDSKYQLQSLVH